MQRMGIQKILRRSLWMIAFVIVGWGCTNWGYDSWAQPSPAINLPSPPSAKLPVKGKTFMVAAANPYAVQAGYEILKKGGNSIDALVAIQLVLTLVEPQSSGLGGGSFLVYFDGKTHQLNTFDGREMAPLQATPHLFLDQTGKPLEFFEAVVGGRSVGVPGTLKLLWEVHQRYGKLPWSQLFQPAIQLADHGFIVSKLLANLVKLDQDHLSHYPQTRHYFFNPQGDPIQAGQRLSNPELANTLRILAQQGITPFYAGEIGQDIVKTVHEATDNPGLLTPEDLQRYTVVERSPVCITYRRVYQVCGMGPPSSGGVAIGEILGVLNAFDLRQLGPENPRSWFLIGEATRLAFADRERYLGDSDFISVPVEGLLNPHYLLDRSRLIDPQEHPLKTVSAGDPEGSDLHTSLTPAMTLEQPCTTHISIVDAEGKLLMIQRAANDTEFEPLGWHMLGTVKRFFDTREAALARVLRGEIGQGVDPG